MRYKTEITFSNILVGLDEHKAKLEKPRTARRVNTPIPVYVEVKGQLFEALVADASYKVIRLDTAFPLTLNEPCSIIFKGKPAFQVTGIPIVGDAEFKRGGWNRVTLKSGMDLDKLVALFSEEATAV